MSDVVLAALITGVPSTVAAIMSILNAMRLGDIHISINSRMDELLQSGRSESRAVGKAEGIDEERRRME